VKELSNSKKTNKKPMGFGAQLAAGLYSLFIPVHLVAAPL